MLSKFSNFVESYNEELFLVTAIVLVGLVSFGLGRLSVDEGSLAGELIIESTPVVIDEVVSALSQPQEVSQRGSVVEPSSVVGNKNSKIYHLAECSGAQRMSDKNKIFFASIIAAKEAGYRPAGNCPEI